MDEWEKFAWFLGAIVFLGPYLLLFILDCLAPRDKTNPLRDELEDAKRELKKAERARNSRPVVPDILEDANKPLL